MQAKLLHLNVLLFTVLVIKKERNIGNARRPYHTCERAYPTDENKDDPDACSWMFPENVRYHSIYDC